MDRSTIPPSMVGVITLPPVRIHQRNPYDDHRSLCGKKMRTLSEMRVDFLQPRPLCLRCFGRAGTISYTSSDRNAVIEFHMQEKLDV